MKGWILLAVVSILVILAAIALFLLPAPAKAPTGATYSSVPDVIEVSAPANNASVGSPLVVSGQARGSWYFEASFPVKLLDSSGAVLAQVPAQAQGDWMTSDFVPFSVTLNFPQQPSGSTGVLILHNDNPSGDPARDQQVSVPVVFR